MNNRTIKYASLGLGGLVGLIGIVLVMLALSKTDNPDDLGVASDGFFYVIYAAFIACAGLAILFGVLQAVSAPKKAIGAVAGIVALVIVFAISYGMAGDEVNWIGKSAQEIRQINEKYPSGVRKFSGAAINATFILLILAIVSLLGMEAYRKIKK
jgi:hypothetical protein